MIGCSNVGSRKQGSSAWMPFLKWIVCGVVVASPAVRASGGPYFSDDVFGATCQDIVRSMNLQWQRPGGDWVDAGAMAYGESPYASVRVGASRRRQDVTVALNGLVAHWQSGEATTGAVVLRGVSGAGSSAVLFGSRESTAPESRPSLEIRLDNGVVKTLHPIADTYLPCSTVNSVGSKKFLRVERNLNAIVQFPMEGIDIHRVDSAKLRLSTERQYGEALSIGLFGLTLPAPMRSPLRLGLASEVRSPRALASLPSVVLVEDFESDDWASEWDRPSPNSHAEIVGRNEDRGFDPWRGKALKVTVLAGKVQGLSTNYRFKDRLGHEPEEMYFRYYLRLDENWNPTKEGGKLPGFAGTYGKGGWGGRKADGRNGWTARGAFFKWRRTDSPNERLRGIGTSIATPDIDDRYGDVIGWNLGPTGMLEKGRWYCIEQYVKLNSPGVDDGVLRAWVDGRLAFERPGIRFRDVSSLKIESLWLNVYHGGTNPTPHDLSLYIDDLVIARQYIGPSPRIESK